VTGTDAPDRAYEAGRRYESTFYGCAQCSVAALQDTFDRRDDGVFRAATGLSGGGGLAIDGSCGAYAGAIMFLGQLLGRTRDDFTDEGGVRLETATLVRRLRQRFIDEYGSVVCRDIQTRMLGRPYYIADPEEFRRFHDAGAHSEHCPEVVGRAARWAAEIVVDEGLA
jgi:C_GCAxxG_C_C family probable redox protein